MLRFAIFMVGEEMQAILYEPGFSAAYMDMRVATAKSIPFGKRDVTGWADVMADSIEEAVKNKNAAVLLSAPADTEDAQAPMNTRPVLGRQVPATANRVPDFV